MQEIRGLMYSKEYFILCEVCGFTTAYEPNNGPYSQCQKCNYEIDDRTSTIIIVKKDK